MHFIDETGGICDCVALETVGEYYVIKTDEEIGFLNETFGISKGCHIFTCNKCGTISTDTTLIIIDENYFNEHVGKGMEHVIHNILGGKVLFKCSECDECCTIFSPKINCEKDVHVELLNEIFSEFDGNGNILLRRDKCTVYTTFVDQIEYVVGILYGTDPTRKIYIGVGDMWILTRKIHFDSPIFTSTIVKRKNGDIMGVLFKTDNLYLSCDDKGQKSVHISLFDSTETDYDVMHELVDSF